MSKKRAQARAAKRARARANRERRRDPARALVSAMMLFFFSAFLLIAFNGEIQWQGFALAVVVPGLMYIAT